MLLFDCIFVVATLLAALYDFIYYKIPNFLVVFLIVTFVSRVLIMTPVALWLMPATLFHPLIVFISVIIVGFVLFRFNVLGAGDVKILAITAAWATACDSLLLFLLIMSGFGGVLGLIYTKGVYVLNNGRIKLAQFFNQLLSWPTLTNEEADSVVSKEEKTKTLVPYGVAIGAAVLTLFIINMSKQSI